MISRFFIFATLLIFLVECSIPTSNYGRRSQQRNNALGLTRKKEKKVLQDAYHWQKITGQADFPQSYNGEIYHTGKELILFLSNGIWRSENGEKWVKSSLTPLLNTAYQDYIYFKGMFYAPGQMKGNYQNLQIDPNIYRSSDLKNWELIATNSNFPKRVFYKTVVFENKIWLAGGYDGQKHYNDLWNSEDGIHWQKAVEAAPWDKRNPAAFFVFRKHLWLIGGGVLDQNAKQDVWRSKDGLNWELVTSRMHPEDFWGYSTVVYDDKIWLLGCNRNGNFTSEIMYSEDGKNWNETKAPWSPRGGVMACVSDNKILLTGGKYSKTENGQIRFIYSNDLWWMYKKQHHQANHKVHFDK